MSITTTAVLATPTTVYTSSGESVVTFLSLCNYDTVTRAVDIHVVPSGGSADDSNIFISALDVVADDTYIAYQGSEKLILGDGDFIAVTAAAATAVTAILSYYQA